MGGIPWGRIAKGVATGGLSEIGNAAGDIVGTAPGAPGINAKRGLNDSTRDNGDGTFTDLTTGQTFTQDGNGNIQPLAAPNAAQQVGQANTRAADYLYKADPYAKREQQTFDQQQQLAKNYNDVLTGKAPSVAGTQLQHTLGQVQDAATSMAAGGRGINGALAQQNAMRVGANAALQAGQQGAELRARETDAARTGLANTLGGMAGESTNLYNTNLGAGEHFSDSALAGESGREKLDTTAAEDNQKGRGAVFSAGGGFLGTILSDKRSKRGIKRASFADALAKSVHGITYEYKPGKGDGGAHFGVTADDVEKVVPGAVSKRGDGLKEIAAPHLTAANTAIIAELGRRVKALEGRRA